MLCTAYFVIFFYRFVGYIDSFGKKPEIRRGVFKIAAYFDSEFQKNRMIYDSFCKFIYVNIIA